MLLVFRNDYINNGVEMVRECVENVFGPVCQHTIFFLVLSPSWKGWEGEEKSLSRVH